MKKVILIVLSIILMSSVLIINIYSHVELKNNVNHTTTKNMETTTKTTDDISSDERIEKITIEGQVEEMVVKNYVTHLGFNFDYDVDMFNPVLLSNGSVLVNDIFNANIYIKFEKLTESEYFSEYDSINNKEEISDDGYLSTYSFFRGNNIYLKVTKRIYNSPEYLSGINVRMEYVIGSLKFN